MTTLAYLTLAATLCVLAVVATVPALVRTARATRDAEHAQEMADWGEGS